MRKATAVSALLILIVFLTYVPPSEEVPIILLIAKFAIKAGIKAAIKAGIKKGIAKAAKFGAKAAKKAITKGTKKGIKKGVKDQVKKEVRNRVKDEVEKKIKGKPNPYDKKLHERLDNRERHMVKKWSDQGKTIQGEYRKEPWFATIKGKNPDQVAKNLATILTPEYAERITVATIYRDGWTSESEVVDREAERYDKFYAETLYKILKVKFGPVVAKQQEVRLVEKYTKQMPSDKIIEKLADKYCVDQTLFKIRRTYQIKGVKEAKKELLDMVKRDKKVKKGDKKKVEKDLNGPRGNQLIQKALDDREFMKKMLKGQHDKAGPLKEKKGKPKETVEQWKARETANHRRKLAHGLSIIDAEVNY